METPEEFKRRFEALHARKQAEKQKAEETTPMAASIASIVVAGQYELEPTEFECTEVFTPDDGKPAAISIPFKKLPESLYIDPNPPEVQATYREVPATAVFPLKPPLDFIYVDTAKPAEVSPWPVVFQTLDPVDAPLCPRDLIDQGMEILLEGMGVPAHLLLPRGWKIEDFYDVPPKPAKKISPAELRRRDEMEAFHNEILADWAESPNAYLSRRDVARIRERVEGMQFEVDPNCANRNGDSFAPGAKESAYRAFRAKDIDRRVFDLVVETMRRTWNHADNVRPEEAAGAKFRAELRACKKMFDTVEVLRHALDDMADQALMRAGCDMETIARVKAARLVQDHARVEEITLRAYMNCYDPGPSMERL